MAHIHELYDFTVGAYILHPNEPKICLHLHLKLNTWLQPGGHIELNEDPEEALAHELLEEVGFFADDYEIIKTQEQPSPRGSKPLNMPFHLDVHRFGDTEHKHIGFGYLVQAKTDKLSPQEGESKEIAWFSIDEVRELHRKNKMYDGTLDICEWIFSNFDNYTI